MKKLLIGIIALGSISSYAITEFEQSLSESEIIFEESKNYQAKHLNDDGSITIFRPRFKNPNGSGNLGLSVESENNLAGICKLFGAGSYVSNSSLFVSAQGTLVRISRNGTFEKFDSSFNKNAVESLICLPSTRAQVGPSDNAENILRNDDGLITIFKPKFSNPDGSGSLRLSIDNEYNLTGICKLFGASSYVSNSVRFVPAQRTLVRISRNGTFEKFDSSLFKNAVESLICRL
jgi:hypothetical protein